MLWLVLLVLFVLAIGGGSWGYGRVGGWGFSPVVLILVVVLILWATGHLHLPR